MQTEQLAALRTRLPELLQPAKNRPFYLCPLCGSGTGPNKTGALHLDQDGLHCKCFSCGFYGDIFDLVARLHNLDTPAAFKRTRELLGDAPSALPINHTSASPSTTKKTTDSITGDIPAYIAACAAALWQAPEALSYLRGRGFSDETLRTARLGYDTAARQIVIPYGESYFIRRGVGEAKRFYKPPTAAAGPEPLFGAAQLASASCIFVVESQLCALSVGQAGGAAVALGGTGAGRLVKVLTDTKPDTVLVLALDNDARGRETAEKLAAQLDSLDILHLSFNLAGTHKDPNEALQREPAALADRVRQATARALAHKNTAQTVTAEAWRAHSAAARLGLFFGGVQAEADTPAVPTGFAALDNALDGGLYEGLYVIGAISSLGKTTFALQLADQIAASGRDVLFFSLEMAASELMAKSLSRLSWRLGGEALAKTARGITAGARRAAYTKQELDLLDDAAAAYAAYAGNLYIIEGLGDVSAAAVGEGIEKHRAATGQTPVVLVDYLQILAPAEPRATDKQNTDRAVFMLKQASRSYKTPVIAISSLNRENYTAKLSMAAFKESGAIEYSSDVLLGLQPGGLPAGERLSAEVLDDWKAAEPRAVELRILKNRHGPSGGAVNFDYHARYNAFSEVDVPEKRAGRR